MPKKSGRGRGSAKKYNARVAIIIFIVAVVIAVIVAVILLKSGVFSLEGSTRDEGPSAPNEGAEAEIASADFSIHFPMVGNKAAGDCILIDCGSTEVLIDAGSQQSSAATIKQYVDRYCTDGTLEYVIATHADSDHISGFYGNSSGATRTGIFYQYKIGTLIKFDTSNKPLTSDSGGKTLYSNFLDGVEMLKSKGTNVYTGDQCYNERGGAKRTYFLDEGNTLSLTVLYNYYYTHHATDENNYSVVTLLTKTSEEETTHYLFTGDLEEDGEKQMVLHYPEGSRDQYDILPQVKLYKAGHHGSKTSSTKMLIDVIRPENVVVCCCAGSPEYTTANLNTFPTQQMFDNVRKYTDNIYAPYEATDLPELAEIDGNFENKKWDYKIRNGNIVFFMKEGEMKLYCSGDSVVLPQTDWYKKYRT